MARLITKFKYLKPDARTSVGGYARYIATREGVEKIDQTYRLSLPTQKQQQLIEKILKDFPDSKEMLEYLTAAVEHGNQYAAQLLHSVKSNRNWSAAMGAIRLLHHLAHMLQNQLEDERKEKAGAIDRKLKRKIDRKKQAHGLRQG